MSIYRRAKLVFDSFRSTGSRLLLTRSSILAKDVTGRTTLQSSLLPSNKPNFRGFFTPLIIKPVSDVGRRIIDTAQSSTSLFRGRDLPIAPNRKRWYVLSFVGSVVVFILCFGKFETIPFTNRTHFVILSPKREKKFGDWLIQYSIENFTRFKGKMLPDTHPQTIRVRRIADKLSEALQREIVSDQNKKCSTLHLDGRKYQIFLLEDPQLLRVMVPGGTIILSTRVLYHFGQDEEIAMLMAHLIAEDVARHIAEKLSHPMLFLANTRSVLNRKIYDASDEYYFPKFTAFWFSRLQRMVTESDYIGMLLYASAGYNPTVAPGVYTKLGKLLGEDPNKKNCLSVWPSEYERAEKLSQAHVMEEALSRYEDVQARFVDI